MKSRIEHLPRLALLGLALLTFAQCKKADPPTPTVESLPPATQEGKNTLGFMLNGRVWNARVEPHKPSYSKLECSYYQGTFSIAAYRILGDSVHHQFVFNSNIQMNKLGTYQLGYVSSSTPSASLYISKKRYRSKDNNSSWLTVTKIDTLSRPKIISGTFTMNLLDSDDNKLEIREGRFDINMP